MSWRVGIDIGGTFTDIAVASDDGSVVLWKEDSTRDRPETAIQRGLAAVAERFGLTLEAFLADTTQLVHGSTIATNAVIERDGPTVGLVCTAGFRDVLLFRDGFKWDRFNVRLARPEDFVPRHRRLGVVERIGPDGGVRTELDESSVREAAQRIREAGVEAVAVSLLWSNANPAHERRVREILHEQLDGLPIVLASDVLPEVGEWVRTSAAVLSAYVYPGSARYLQELEGWLREHGLDRGVLIMQINGGCASVQRTLQVPVNILNSGPAAAPAAALDLGRRAGFDDIVTVDMGGTSFDVCVIRDREIPLSRAIQAEHQPIGVQGVEVHTVGAGGGSIAWIDSGGALRVGPESAGARPGPAAYGFGGERPTVTDANIVLGYLEPSAFLGGRRSLDAELARQAIATHVAGPLGIDVVAAAAGIIEVVNTNMAEAIRVVSVQRGIDPRPFLMVAGGGAGPLHAARLAGELGMTRVLVPAQAGTICAFGMTVTDVRHDYAALAHTSSTTPDLATVTEVLETLERRARADLRAQGFTDDQIRIERSVDARYEGQVHDLTVPVPTGPVDAALFTAAADAYHRVHHERYTWSMEAHPVEFLHWRVTGLGLIQRPMTAPELATDRVSAVRAQVAVRRAYFSESAAMVDTPVYESDRFVAGATLVGPAIVQSATTTIVVNPAQRLTADGRGSFMIELGGVAT